MSDGNDSAGRETGTAPSTTEPPARESEPGGEPDLRAALEAEGLRAAEYEGKYRRALADYMNLERRTAANVEGLRNRAVDEVLREFLDIYDDFVRARDSYGAGGADTSGLDSVLRNAEALLRRRGVKPMESAGKPFDPKFHEALSTKPDPSVEEQTVVQEVRKGYIISDRVLRSALVVVSTREERQ